MGMPSQVDDSVTLQEINRTLSDFRAEVRGSLQQVVRLDVYRAEQAAMLARAAAIEKDVERLETELRNERARKTEDLAANRRLILAAFGTGLAGIVVALVSAIITAALT